MLHLHNSNGPKPHLKREASYLAPKRRLIKNAASVVDEIVRRGAANPDHPRQVALAERLMPEVLAQQLEFYQREWRDPEEPLWLAAIDGWPFDRA